LFFFLIGQPQDFSIGLSDGIENHVKHNTQTSKKQTNNVNSLLVPRSTDVNLLTEARRGHKFPPKPNWDKFPRYPNFT
jgi:hypothetical protein